MRLTGTHFCLVQVLHHPCVIAPIKGCVPLSFGCRCQCSSCPAVSRPSQGSCLMPCRSRLERDQTETCPQGHCGYIPSLQPQRSTGQKLCYCPAQGRQMRQEKGPVPSLQPGSGSAVHSWPRAVLPLTFWVVALQSKPTPSFHPSLSFAIHRHSCV